ncbi:MAG TPA: hemagglutinin repeat-containing protein, partial [Cellvibrionaceae bacterium]|nr:hemagglutinin repeat-containing protein [Cellvibrionaceae bacterium]
AGITTGRNLTAKAARDFNLEGQTINTQGDATLSATRDVTITPTTERSLTSGGNTSTEAVTHTATKITTGGSLSIDAGRDLGITATKIDTGKDLTLRGERDVTLTSAADSTHTEGQGKNWHTIETDVKQVTTNISAGGNIDANAGQDLNLVAVKGKADGDIHLSAKRDTNLLGAVDSEYDYSYEKKKKSLGRSKTKESESLTETAVATELSAGGNLLLNTKLGSKGEILKETGQRINTEGAKLSAGDPEASGETQGTIAAYAADGIILAGQTTKSLDYSETRRSGTLGLSKKAKGSNTGEDHSSATTLTSADDTQLLSDHNLTLEGVVADVDGDMTLSAVDDLRVTPGETHTQTQTWNNKSGAFSGGSLYRKTEVNSDGGSTDLTDSALIVKGNLTVDAGSTEILGTRIQTGSQTQTGNLTATTDSGDLSIGAAQASSFHKDSTLDIRLKGTDTLKALKEPHKIVENDDGRAKLKLGSATYLNADNSKTTLSQQGSEVTAFGDISLDATGPVGTTSVAGSTLSATGLIDLHSTQALALSSVDETTTERHKTQEGKGEASFVVQHQAVEVAKAAKNLLDAKEQLSDAKRSLKQYENNLDTQKSQLNQLKADLAAGTPGVTADDVQLLSELVRDLEDDRAWYQTGLALATVNLASASTALLQQSAAAAASTSTWGFNAGLQLDLSASETKEETFNSTSIGSTLNADTIKLSTGIKNPDGSLNTQGTRIDMQGADVNGRDVSITTGTLDARSREDTTRHSSQSKQGQLSAQVTVYGAAGGASVNGSFQRAESDSQSTTVHNTNIHADTLNITTSGDANLEGATARAEEKLTVDVGGNLTLDSQQNRSSSKSHEQGMSAGIGWGGDGEANKGNAFSKNIQTGGDVGSTNSTNAGISQGNSRSRTQETVVTSLTSGGTADITVKGNTQLGGAILGTLEKVDVCADKNSKACKTEQV